MRTSWSRRPISDEPDELTSAAFVTKALAGTLLPKYESWQKEGWAFWDELGEFRFAIEWKSEMISRIRLRAGQVKPDQDEPEILDKGPAVDLLAELGGGPTGQPEMLGTIATQFNVAGDSYLIGEEKRPGLNDWIVRSADEFRLKSKATGSRPAVYEMIDDDASIGGTPVWRELKPQSLIVRIWRPHKRKRYLADSPVRAMRGAMRELELINRRIVAQLLSRLASAGMIAMPSEISFPTARELNDEEDEFVVLWIETAKEAIAEPGSAAACIPMPIRAPAELIDKIKHFDFTLKDDEGLIAKRESAIRRLATQIDVPAEVLLGMGDINHWGQWMIEESAIKTHIATDMELICGALTKGYLQPMLKAKGIDDPSLVVWYDASELTIRPDRSQNAKDARERHAITDKAFRRELGFDEADAPTEDELYEMVLHDLAGFVTTGPWALSVIQDDPALLANLPEYQSVPGVQEAVGREVVEAPTTDGPGAPVDDTTGEPDDAEPADRGEPDTGGEPPVPPGPDRAAQAAATHRLEVHMGGWTLHHPKLCQEATFSCPVTEASRALPVTPGTPGDYECALNPTGELVVGQRTYASRDDLVPGHTRKRRQRATNGARPRP